MHSYGVGTGSGYVKKSIHFSICKEKDVLKEYLMGEEAATVMYKFSDQIESMNEALDRRYQ